MDDKYFSLADQNFGTKFPLRRVECNTPKSRLDSNPLSSEIYIFVCGNQKIIKFEWAITRLFKLSNATRITQFRVSSFIRVKGLSRSLCFGWPLLQSSHNQGLLPTNILQLAHVIPRPLLILSSSQLLIMQCLVLLPQNVNKGCLQVRRWLT